MSLARDALSRGTRSISELAFATGYKSESAFSTAFRRVTGSSPKHFREASNRADRPAPGVPGAGGGVTRSGQVTGREGMAAPSALPDPSVSS
ncbi:helix-turn-helix domain-containing protein [Actinacidiphila acididurans]|uniref:helix-turn-helix domain-containing protein n=1 Tax=Actinacidiphila acididurans TaxID=2784346 RepID=UPI001F158BED|nr:helix-turn-helix domain-containing protein [Actinacidiphila acididurans]